MDRLTGLQRCEDASENGVYLNLKRETRVGKGEMKKQVRTNNNAAFQCNFLFNILFILRMLSVSIGLFLQLISLEFVIGSVIFTMWLQTYGWTDGQTDGQKNGQTQNNGRTD